jgi:hypothetical protein
VSPKQVEGAYQRYQLEIIKELSEEENSWVFSFASSLISDEEIVELLNDSQFISKAKILKE